MIDKISETRAESAARELIEIRGWRSEHPPKGNLLWKNEYREYPILREALTGASKSGGGDGYPDFLVVDRASMRPLIVGETKATAKDIGLAIEESVLYAKAFKRSGYDVLAAGIAGDGENDIAVQIEKRKNGRWSPIEFRGEPIQWMPTPEETDLLLSTTDLFNLDPRVPAPEVLAERGDEINRILRECDIKDEFRPAIIAAFMLALWESRGDISPNPDRVLGQVNDNCRRAFERAGKFEIAKSIVVPEANAALAAQAARLCRILRLLNVTTLTAAHDYLGQLYEMFFRFTGGNTIGQYFTPRHITRFVVNLCGITDRDIVVDPTCGTGGFLIAALYRMIGDHDLTPAQMGKLVRDRLYGFESEPITAALCVANMILRGDGTTGIRKGDCFSDPDYPENKATFAIGNPPFPHSNTDTPIEKFVNRALDALRIRGIAAMIVKASLLTKSGLKQEWRSSVLRNNTLRGVITLPGELFQPYASSTTAVLLIEKGIPHRVDDEVFFAHIENDGFRLKKNVRIEQPGEELTGALEAYHHHGNLPGHYGWKTLTESDWAPGAYIDSAPAGDAELKKEIEDLFRNESAFHALHANELAEFHRRIIKGEINSAPYPPTTSGRGATVRDDPTVIGNYFTVYYGQKELHNKEGLEPGTSLIVSARGEDNGCFGFYEFDKLIDPPFATIPSTGSIGMGFVQHWPCGVTDDCLLLFPKEKTPIEALYVAAAVVRLERWRFNYGRKITPQRILRFKLPMSDELIQWIKIRLAEVSRLSHRIIASPALDAKVEGIFKKLADTWRSERKYASTVSQMVLIPSYQRIIGMGEIAIPFILRELRSKPDHWFWALTSITGVDPVPEEIRGKTKEMAGAWIEWGKKYGYLQD